VKDNKTGLTWQREVPATGYNWENAKSYCPTLNALKLGGFEDGWRLPTKIELETLVVRWGAPPGPAIDIEAFPSTPDPYFWTETPVAGNSSNAWFVGFVSGYSNYYYTNNTRRVRCVR